MKYMEQSMGNMHGETGGYGQYWCTILVHATIGRPPPVLVSLREAVCLVRLIPSRRSASAKNGL